MQEDERSDVLIPFYCAAADGDPQQHCCAHSISLQTGAVVGGWCNRGEGRACRLVLTKKDPRSRGPILTLCAIHKSQRHSIAVDRVDSSVWRKLLVRAVMTVLMKNCICNWNRIIQSVSSSATRTVGCGWVYLHRLNTAYRKDYMKVEETSALCWI